MAHPIPELIAIETRMDFLEVKIMDSLEAIKTHQERMCDDIAKIKEAVYNPDDGLYARLRALEADTHQKNKLLWVLLTTILTVSAAGLVAYLQ